MIFKYNFEIGLENLNRENNVSNKSLLQFLENIASKHSDSIQSGVNSIMNQGITWVLLGWKLKVLERPKYGDILEIHTWVRNSTKLYSYRDFEIYINGEKKAIASSKWLLADKNTLRPLKITDEILSKYSPEVNKNVFGITEFDKLEEQELYEKQIPYPIRKSDIDINNHVHNLNYLDMAYEISDTEKEFDNVSILYKKEIKYNDEINIFLGKNENRYYFKIMDTANNTVNSLLEMY